ncbi:MAG: DUF308 domain-containing protein [Candidatus Sulfotelmatobacter sp.]
MSFFLARNFAALARRQSIRHDSALLVVSGIVEAIHAFRVWRWGGFFLHLVGGILGVLVGLLIVTNPVAGALA